MFLHRLMISLWFLTPEFIDEYNLMLIRYSVGTRQITIKTDNTERRQFREKIFC